MRLALSASLAVVHSSSLRLIQSVENAMKSAAAQEQTRAHRAIGAMQFRLGDLTNSLSHLEQALEAVQDPPGRARTLIIKAMCLQKLERTDEARVAFVEGETILQPLVDRSGEIEGFLSEADRNDILMHREAQTLLGPN